MRVGKIERTPEARFGRVDVGVDSVTASGEQLAAEPVEFRLIVPLALAFDDREELVDQLESVSRPAVEHVELREHRQVSRVPQPKAVDRGPHRGDSAS